MIEFSAEEEALAFEMEAEEDPLRGLAWMTLADVWHMVLRDGFLDRSR